MWCVNDEAAILPRNSGKASGVRYEQLRDTLWRLFDKRVTSSGMIEIPGSEGGRRKSAPLTQSNSPAAYLTLEPAIHARRITFHQQTLAEVSGDRR